MASDAQTPPDNICQQKQPKNAVVIPFQRDDDRTLSYNQWQDLRVLEAILFASSKPVSALALQNRLSADADVKMLIEVLQSHYKGRGIVLMEVAGGIAFRTAEDLSYLLQNETIETRKLSRAALETLAIIAYHQPVTRAEIENIRGVSTSRGTLDVLLETGWIRMRGRRRSPGRPVTYGTTSDFLDHFMLAQIGDLPGLEELKGAGLLDSAMPVNFKIPIPTDDEILDDNEETLIDENGTHARANSLAEDQSTE